MTALIERHVVKITIGAFIAVIITAGGAVWQIALAYSTQKNHETRITNLEKVMGSVATSDDIETLKNDLKDYINK